ncbi:MAG: hypothetical protein PHW65_01620 [Dehalococcoidales bacterium]|nr:hypothetical protein [Dehalococcoidales bacterium]
MSEKIDTTGKLYKMMNKDAGETYDQGTDSLEALGEAIAALAATETYPDGAVFYDEFSGITGTAYPYGTPEYPVNSEADALAIAIANKLTRIRITGSFTVPDTMEGYAFIGEGRYSAMDTVLFNGQDVDTSSFHKLAINGAQGGTGMITCYYCYLTNPTNISGTFHNCLVQACSIMAGATACDFIDCAGWQGNAVITVGTPNPLNLFGWEGYVQLAAMTAGVCNVYAKGAVIDIAASSTGGTINIYGVADIINNTGGAVVNDYTLNTALGLRDAAATADDLSDITTTDVQAKIRRILNRLSTDAFTATIQGAARTELDTMMAQLATYVSAAGAAYSATVDPGGAARTNIEQTLEDVGAVLAGAGVTTFPAGAAPGDGVSLAEAIRYISENVSTTVCCMDFWSTPEDAIDVDAVATDIALPDVVVSGLPGTVVRAVAMLKFRMVRETSGGANALDGAQEIQVRDDSPSAWLDAINLIADQFTLAADANEGGDVLIGSIDVKATVDGDDTYNFQWDEALADADDITFNDIQVGLRIWCRVP